MVAPVSEAVVLESSSCASTILCAVTIRLCRAVTLEVTRSVGTAGPKGIQAARKSSPCSPLSAHHCRVLPAMETAPSAPWLRATALHEGLRLKRATWTRRAVTPLLEALVATLGTLVTAASAASSIIRTARRFLWIRQFKRTPRRRHRLLPRQHRILPCRVLLDAACWSMRRARATLGSFATKILHAQTPR